MKFECMKLMRRKVFLVLTLGLLVGNALLIYIREYTQERYHVVYERRSQYEQFLAGDDSVAGADVYAAEEAKQETYIESYPQFLSGMKQRVEMQKKLEIYEADSYASRNLEKSYEDYQGLSGIRLEKGNNYGIEVYSGYHMGIFFVFCFLLISVYYMVYEERGKGLFLLTKGTKNGHAVFVARKGLVLCMVCGIYTLAQELITIALFAYWYGFGNLQRSIQSVPQFRNCPYRINIWMAVVGQTGIRILVAVVLTAVVYLIGICIRNEVLALVLSAGILGLLYISSTVFSLYGSVNGVRCINPFFVWSIDNTFGTYLNLNLFGFPVGKNVAAAAMGLAVVVIACIVGAYVFHRSCQIRSKSRLEKFLYYIRKKTAWRWQHTSLFRFELSKLMIGQKRIIVLLLLGMWCVYSVWSVHTVHFYPTAELMSYHNFMKNIHGRITDESLAYVETQITNIDELYNQIEVAMQGDTEKNAPYIMNLQHELQIKEDAVRRLQNQRDNLFAQKGSIYDKYFVDEVAYNDIWQDVTGELVRWFVCAGSIMFLLCGIFAFDEKKGISPLLSATVNGRRMLERQQKRAGWFGACMLIALTEIPILYEYWHIDGFSCLQHRLSDFWMLSMSGSFTIGAFIAVTMFFQIISLLFVTYAGMKLALFVKNEIVSCVIGIGILGCAFFILYITQKDFTGLILSIQM